MIVNDPDSIIDKKELRNIKITIHNKNSLPKNENMSNKIERDIVNPDDIILPRRPSKVLYLCDTYCLMFIIEKLFMILYY